jgi:hypothetical protein
MNKIPLKSPDFSLTIPRTIFAENPLKFPYDTYNSPIASKYPQKYRYTF